MRCSLAQLGTHLGDADMRTGEVFYSNASAHLKSYLAYAAIRERISLAVASCRLVLISLQPDRTADLPVQTTKYSFYDVLYLMHYLN